MKEEQFVKLNDTVQMARHLLEQRDRLQEAKNTAVLNHTDITIIDWSNSASGFRFKDSDPELLNAAKEAIAKVLQQRIDQYNQQFADLEPTQ